jgi:hypothetical protein
MKTTLKLTYLLVLAILITTFACSKDDNKIEISLENLEVTIDENPSAGQVIGTIQSSQSGSLIFNIDSQSPEGALSIDATTGELTVLEAALFDYERNPTLMATVSAEGAINTANVTINLLNIELATQDLSVTMDENPTNGQSVGTIQTSGSSILNFSIYTQTPLGALTIDASTGELTVADAALFDFETNPVITASISDGESVNPATVTINLTNVNEITIQNSDLNIDENPTNGQSIGTVQTTGGTPLNFSITSQTPAGAVSINANTGELTVNNAALFDFETNTTVSATITTDDAINPTTLTINLNNINEIGDFNHGGVVFWLDGNGGGLVCTISDLNSGALIQWGNGIEYQATGANATAIGTGQANTNAIINIQGAGNYAASLCDNLTLNGYSDWFLPSQDELNEMYINNPIINTVAVANGGVSFSLYYWTSSQATTNTNIAWIQFFQGGSQQINNKFNTAYVRAIRTF